MSLVEEYHHQVKKLKNINVETLQFFFKLLFILLFRQKDTHEPLWVLKKKHTVVWQWLATCKKVMYGIWAGHLSVTPVSSQY